MPKERGKKRSQARLQVLKKEPLDAASHESISKQVRAVAKRRGAKARHLSAKKAAKTRKSHAHAGA